MTRGFYRAELERAKRLTSSEIEAMGLDVVWRGGLISDRSQEPFARPIVISGANGLFPGYVFDGTHVIFSTIPCKTVEAASTHAVAAMREILLNE